MNKSNISIDVKLDEGNHPVDIEWTALNNGTPIAQSAKGMLLSFFDKESLETFKIDLWTNDMQVAEMDRFMFHTLRSLGETYYKATNNADLANDMQKFIQYFGEKTNIIPKE